jgi:hypothetical protein
VKFSGDLIRYMRDENAVRKSAGTMLSDVINKYSLYFIHAISLPQFAKLMVRLCVYHITF